MNAVRHILLASHRNLFFPPPFIHSLTLLLLRTQSVIGRRHTLNFFPHACRASSFRCVIRVRGSDWARGPSVHFINSQYPKSILAHLKEERMEKASQPTRKMRTDKANKWKLQPLIMLIKHCVEYHCNATANEDLSANEEYNMIMDRDKESSDHLSLAVVFACTLQHRRQHFISPWWLLTQMAVLRFMVAESVYCFPFSLSTWSYYR